MQESTFVYKLLISYDGTAYSGWQIQPNAPSIQEEIEKRLAIYLRQNVRLIGAGRTDAGVHAIGQVAHFKTDREIDPYRLCYSLNCMLPADIRIRDLERADTQFHAQYSALGKIYHYHVWTEEVMDPCQRLYRTHIKFPLNLGILQKAAALFIGTHDFSTFANKGSSVKTSVRCLKRLDCIPQEGGFRLEFEGDGFLYKMVRNTTYVLLEVAAGRRSLEEIPLLFAAKDRRRINMAAPSNGLFLMKVFY